MAPGFTVDYVLSVFGDNGFHLNCDSDVPGGPVASREPGKASCWKHPSGNVQFGLNVEGTADAELTEVEAWYSSMTQRASQTNALAFLETMTKLSYEGSKPDAALSWVHSTWDAARATPIETTIGSGRFVLQVKDDSAGSEYTLRLLPEQGSFLK